MQRTQAKEFVRRPRIPLAAIIRNVPKGHHWGRFSREVPRMHLQTVDGKHHYKIWLEENGKRIFEPVDEIPSAVLKKISEEVAEHYKFVETNWVRFMIKKGWLKMHIALPIITLVAYPNYAHKFTRTFDLREEIVEPYLSELTSDVIALNEEMGSLRLWTNRHESQAHDIRFSSILWGD
jgi:hypothetical protein